VRRRGLGTSKEPERRVKFKDLHKAQTYDIIFSAVAACGYQDCPCIGREFGRYEIRFVLVEVAAWQVTNSSYVRPFDVPSHAIVGSADPRSPSLFCFDD
jgi:hypothetical protein